MKIACNRCGTKLERPNKSNACYISETVMEGDKPINKKLIICKKCKKKKDEVIW